MAHAPDDGRPELIDGRLVGTSPEGRPASAGAQRVWWIALGVVAPVLLIAIAIGAYRLGGVILVGVVVGLTLIVVAIRAVPLMIAGTMRASDRAEAERKPEVIE